MRYLISIYANSLLNVKTVLFQTILFSIRTQLLVYTWSIVWIQFFVYTRTVQLNTCHFFTQLNVKTFYFKEFSYHKYTVFRLHTVKWLDSSISYNSIWHVNKVKWFKVLLCITNNSIKHQSFLYIQLSDQTVLFQIIQLSIRQQS